MLFLDVDGFKDVNDTLGPAMGDEMLASIVGDYHAAPAALAGGRRSRPAAVTVDYSAASAADSQAARR